MPGSRRIRNLAETLRRCALEASGNSKFHLSERIVFVKQRRALQYNISDGT